MSNVPSLRVVPQPLVIVESPAKAIKLAEYLGDDYMVESSIGHIRDLPRNAADVPAAYKGEKWARLGIDVDNDFKPLYVVSPDKKSHVRMLKNMLKDASELVLATDKDREGEAIAWHLLEELNPKVPVKRMIFTEITPEAIKRAIENPTELDRRLVDAQECRRLLDRLFGYEVSPVLWKKVMRGLSAGRVQSVATRVVVERERERMAFRSANYWDLTGTFEAAGADKPFSAILLELDAKRIAAGRDFARDGSLAKQDAVHLDEPKARALVSDLEGRPATVKSREAKPYRRRPAAPFITSTYQQDAGRKLRLSSAQAMRVAQGLYERGFITYMRTDSVTLSETAINAARSQIEERYGKDFLPDAPRTYKSKSKNAQEAHEAIRPAGDRFRTPEEVEGELSKQDLQVYELIWQRTVASQMTDATGETVTLRLNVDTNDGRTATFSTAGTVITHQGFLKVYRESKDEDSAKQDPKEQLLPPLVEGDKATLSGLEAAGHDTQPPSRFNEASLVAKLEELGVGRPSTYASIIATIQAREYVWKKGTALVPSFKAFAVVGLLEQHFPDLVDYAFTARMEDDLDSIAEGTGVETIPWLTDFYFGDKEVPGLKDKVNDRLADIDARAINSIPVGADEDGIAIVARVGKFGPYLERGEDRASIPEDMAPDELTVPKALELIEAPKGDREMGEHPETGLMISLKAGRFGPYVQMGVHDDDTGEKPSTSSLFKDMEPEALTLEEAIKLLSIPRLVGTDPADNGEIVAHNGKFGPYIVKTTITEDGPKNDSRSLEAEAELFTIDLEKALVVMAQPKRRRGQSTKGPLKIVGIDPATEKEIQLKDGRFGPYVTDGETNASLRKGDEIETLTLDRASELLSDRRAKGPAKKKKKAAKKKKKATKKKATKKKATKKKATKKKATKKAAAKTSAVKKAAAAKRAEVIADGGATTTEETPF